MNGRNLHIGYFTDTYSPQINGVVTSVDTSARALSKLGHSLYVFAPKMKGIEGPESSVFRFPSVPSALYPGLRKAIPLSRGIMRRVPSLDLDLVHVHTPDAIGLLGTYLARKHSVPTVFTYHTDYPQYFEIYKRAIAEVLVGMLLFPLIVGNGALYRQLGRMLAELTVSAHWPRQIAQNLSALFSNQADGIVAPSEKMRQLLVRWGVTRPIEVIPSGIDPDDFESESYELRRRFGLHDHRIVAYAGRLAKEKNVDLLLHAYARVSRTHEKTKLVIAGDGPHREDLQKHARAIGIAEDAIFLGALPRPQLLQMFGEVDVFAFPSTSDTQGLVVLEAAACGLPIVMIDREIAPVVKDGVSGIYTDNDVEAFARGISSLVERPDTGRRYGRAGMDRAGAYTSQKSADQMIEFYRSLIDARPPRLATANGHGRRKRFRRTRALARPIQAAG